MRRPDRGPQAVQLDLFRPLCPSPDWGALPAEVREKTTRLMARMLRQRKARDGLDRAAGGTDDE
jgi:hypothetical protein